jgi:type IV pilus assembly protein PilM
MNKYFKRLLPEKKHFTGIEIGTDFIKAAEIKITGGFPEVVALRKLPSPPGVWTDNFDEEELVRVLREILNPGYKEAVTCTGGEKTVCRIIQLPQMSDKELCSAVRYEIEKFVPVPIEQLAVRHIRLGRMNNSPENIRAREAQEAGEYQDRQGRQDLLVLAVPLATIYQFHSIFSRAGFTVTAVDLQAFALWRIFGRNTPGVTALADIGAKTSHIILLRDGLIRFTRFLPAGGDNLPEITKELQRSLDYCCAQENMAAEKLVLSGGANEFGVLAGHLQQTLGISTEAGMPDVDFSVGGMYDPAYAVSIGLALREVSSHVPV